MLDAQYQKFDLKKISQQFRSSSSTHGAIRPNLKTENL